MRKACAWLLALALCGAGNATAALRLKLDAPELDPAQREASQQLLDEAADKLPPAFRERLDREIEVEWRDDLPANGMGQARGPQRIALNRKYLADLTDGSAASRQTGRVHGTERRELLATLLHELTHVYDRARLWSAEEKREIRRCTRQEETLGRIAQPTDCRGQSGRRFTLSDDPRLLDLAGWPQRAGQRGRREAHNGFVLRSPDVYELSNPREFVAVNMEYFLLDPSYACRRPALYRYYQQRFGWAPEHSACAQSFAYLNAGRDFGQQPLGQLDPERVYEVDYLLAEANDNLVSRWGHTMLRLVICAPGRPRGPDCRLDLDQHLVLSYRAFVGDLQLSSWDGLTGAYPSRLFVLPLSQVIEEYTKVELRSLASVPLKLDREEVASLVERAAQSHWSYDGQYYFISNNCAVETLKLLRSGIPRRPLQSLDSITPYGVLEMLENRKLADPSVLDDPKEALRLGYRFDSFRDRYQAMFDVLKQRLHIPQDKVEDWLALPARERQPWFAKARPGRVEAPVPRPSGQAGRRPAPGSGRQDLPADPRRQRLPQSSGGTPGGRLRPAAGRRVEAPGRADPRTPGAPAPAQRRPRPRGPRPARSRAPRRAGSQRGQHQGGRRAPARAAQGGRRADAALREAPAGRMVPSALSAPRRRRITLCVIRPTGATSGLRSRVVRSGDELLVLFGQLRVEV